VLFPEGWWHLGSRRREHGNQVGIHLAMNGHRNENARQQPETRGPSHGRSIGNWQ
jgi:hypothetical protein